MTLYEITFVLHIKATDAESARLEARRYVGTNEDLGKVVEYRCEDIAYSNPNGIEKKDALAT